MARAGFAWRTEGGRREYSYQLAWLYLVSLLHPVLNALAACECANKPAQPLLVVVPICCARAHAPPRARDATRMPLPRQLATSPARIRCLHEFRQPLYDDPHDGPPPLDGAFLCHRPCIL